jgi:hypothetical protein
MVNRRAESMVLAGRLSRVACIYLTGVLQRVVKKSRLLERACCLEMPKGPREKISRMT